MQLPRGTFVKNCRGPETLASITDEIVKENLTGYLRVSILSDNATECVVVYHTGKPTMAFVTRAGDDKPDPGLSGIAASIQHQDSIIEVCKLGEKQVALLRELYGNLAYKEPVPQPPQPAPVTAKPAAPQVPATRAVAMTPATGQGVRPQARFVMPEIRGRFVRSEELGTIREYDDRYPADTGHLLFIAQHGGTQDVRGGKQEEHHAIVINGRIEAVYDDKGIVKGVPDWLEGVRGQAEFYAVDPAVLASVLQRSLKTTPAAPAPQQGVVRQETPRTTAPQPLRELPKQQQQPAVSVPEKPPVRAAIPPATVLPPAAPQPHQPASPPRQEPVIEPPKAIGIPAKAILEKSRFSDNTHVEEDINRTLDEISQSMDDDIAMVRKVEQDFAAHVDDLLEKLDLSHLRKDRRK